MVPAVFLYIGGIILVAWFYDFYNGANDAATAIATVISTRVLTPNQALAMAAVLNAVGALISTKVALTLGRGLVDPTLLGGIVLISALVGAAIWVSIATHIGMPVSSTHSLVGGIIGSVAIPYHLGVINPHGLLPVLIAMFLSPVLGSLLAFLLFQFLRSFSHRLSSGQGNLLYSRLQLLSSCWMALTHGMNDAQHAMGMITVALFTTGIIHTFQVPLWVIVGSGLFMGIGTYWGGWRVIKTMGMRLTHLRPFQGFAAETAAGTVIAAASSFGVPISTSQVTTGAIIGVGTAERPRSVRWHVASDIILAWVFTIPGAAIAAGCTYAVLHLFF